MTPSYLTVRKYGSTSTVAHSPLKVSLHVSAKPRLKVVEYRTQCMGVCCSNLSTSSIIAHLFSCLTCNNQE